MAALRTEQTIRYQLARRTCTSGLGTILPTEHKPPDQLRLILEERDSEDAPADDDTDELDDTPIEPTQRQTKETGPT